MRCHTEFGIPPKHLHVRARLRLLATTTARGLVAYTNTEEFVIGPVGFDCAGAVGVDGNGSVTAWPSGQAQPQPGRPGRGVTLEAIPACASCQAEIACPFFLALARRLHFPCRSGMAIGETSVHASADLYGFTDPIGVRGDGWPSGGTATAYGEVGVGGSYGVFRVTCALPASQRRACTTTLGDASARYL